MLKTNILTCLIVLVFYSKAVAAKDISALTDTKYKKTISGDFVIFEKKEAPSQPAPSSQPEQVVNPKPADVNNETLDSRGFVSQDGLSVNKKADAVKYIDLDVINKKIDHRLSMDANFMFATNESSARTTSVFTALADNFDTRANANIKYQASAKIGNVNLSVDSAVVSGRNAGFDEDESVNLDKLYLSLSAEDTFKIEAGIVKPTSENLRVDASTFAKGTGGIDGDGFRIYNYPKIPNANAANPIFITVPRSPLASGFANSAFLGSDNSYRYSGPKLGYGDDLSGVNIYTQRYGDTAKTGGLKLGISFLPNTEDLQSRKVSSSLTSGGMYSKFTLTNATAFTANYYKEFAGTRGVCNLSLSNEFAKIKKTSSLAAGSINRNNLNATTLGFNLEYTGFIIGASYSHWGKSLYYKQDDANLNTKNMPNAYYYTLGGGYMFGPAGLSLGYIKSSFSGNKFDNIAFSADYELLSSKNHKIKYFTEISRYRFFESTDKALNLKSSNIAGYGILTGFSLFIK